MIWTILNPSGSCPSAPHPLSCCLVAAPPSNCGCSDSYKAFDTNLERNVAIKLIRIDAFPPSQLNEILKRFEHEAKFMARLSHAHIVKVYDYGEHEGAPYLVMEYQSGGTLKERLGEPVPYQEAIKLLLPVVHALAFAHKQNMIHRDVKPANILLNGENEPVLSDFGIAKLLETDSGYTLTATGMGIGTPEYMPPEQGLGRKIDARADIYGIGVILYELLSGKKPYTADTPMAVIFKHVNEPIPDLSKLIPDLPPQLVAVLNKLMAKNPADRYEDAGKVIVAFNTVLDSQHIPITIPEQGKDMPTVMGPFVKEQVNTEPFDLGSTAAFNPMINKKASKPSLIRSTRAIISFALVILILILFMAAAFVWPNLQTAVVGGSMKLTDVIIPTKTISAQVVKESITLPVGLYLTDTNTQSPTKTERTIEKTLTRTPSPTLTASQTNTVVFTNTARPVVFTATWTPEPIRLPTNTKKPTAVPVVATPTEWFTATPTAYPTNPPEEPTNPPEEPTNLPEEPHK
jgi:serine/threonine protein kinase